MEVPDYSPIFEKYQKDLETAIISYVNGTLKGVSDHMAFKVNDNDPVYSIENFFRSELDSILPEMDNERRSFEDEIVGDDEDEAYDSGFFGECDEEWDGCISAVIYELIEDGKLDELK